MTEQINLPPLPKELDDYVQHNFYLQGLIKGFARAAVLADRAAREPCSWLQDGPESNGYETGCRQLFNVDPDCDGPLGEWMRFCCFCGKPLREVPYEDEEE